MSFAARSTIAAASAFLLAVPVGAQQAPAGAKAPVPAAAAVAGPQVGEMAPDFALPAVTRFGVLRAPMRLSDLRGETVVVAFFPKARTSGCTVQLETYRDQYATLFNNGRKVVVVAVSADADTTLHGWAKDAGFPFLLASDVSGEMAARYGAWMGDRKMTNRNLYVIGPDGRIAHVAKPFRVMAQDAYDDLGKTVDRLAPPAPAASGAQ